MESVDDEVMRKWNHDGSNQSMTGLWYDLQDGIPSWRSKLGKLGKR